MVFKLSYIVYYHASLNLHFFIRGRRHVSRWEYICRLTRQQQNYKYTAVWTVKELIFFEISSLLTIVVLTSWSVLFVLHSRTYYSEKSWVFMVVCFLWIYFTRRFKSVISDYCYWYPSTIFQISFIFLHTWNDAKPYWAETRRKANLVLSTNHIKMGRRRRSSGESPSSKLIYFTGALFIIFSTLLVDTTQCASRLVNEPRAVAAKLKKSLNTVHHSALTGSASSKVEVETFSQTTLKSPRVGVCVRNFAGRNIKVIAETGGGLPVVEDATLPVLKVEDHIWDGKSIQLTCNATYPVKFEYFGPGVSTTTSNIVSLLNWSILERNCQPLPWRKGNKGGSYLYFYSLSLKIFSFFHRCQSWKPRRIGKHLILMTRQPIHMLSRLSLHTRVNNKLAIIPVEVLRIRPYPQIFISLFQVHTHIKDITHTFPHIDTLEDIAVYLRILLSLTNTIHLLLHWALVRRQFAYKFPRFMVIDMTLLVYKTRSSQNNTSLIVSRFWKEQMKNDFILSWTQYVFV